MTHRLTAALLAIAFALPTFAQPLADRVPADALLYAGWAGAGPDNAAFQGSNTRALIDDIGLADSLTRLFDDAASAMIAEGEEDGAAAVIAARDIAKATWAYPCALFIPAEVDPDDGPSVAIIWQVGDRGQALGAQLDALIQDAPPNAPVKWYREGDLLVFAYGFAGDTPVLTAPAQSLAQHAAFTAALKSTRAHNAFVGFVNLQTILDAADDLAEHDADPQQLETWRKWRDALGLDGFKLALMTAAFTGKDFEVNVFVDAPAPRTGLAGLLDGKPLTDDELHPIPATATWMNAWRFDLADVMKRVRAAAEKIGPDAVDTLNRGVLTGSALAGVDLEKTLIQGLGSAWMIYTDPAVVGPGGYGFCLVNPLRDPFAVKAALTSLETTANHLMASGMGGPGEGGPSLKFSVIEQDEIEIHSLATPLFAPSWAVADGNLYVALFPQAIVMADIFAKQDGRSIVTSPKFQQVRRQLGHADDATGVMFVDLPATAPATYQQFMMLTQFVGGAIAMFSDNPPPMIVPPLGKVLPYLAPAGQVAWVDDAGYHSRTVSPFMGAMFLSPQAFADTTMVAPLSAGVMLPALGAARRTARQMQANTQLRGIHQAQVMYAQSNQGKFTNDISDLTEGNFFTVEYALSPESGKTPPAGYDQWPEEQRRDWVRKNASFILVPNLTDDLDTERIAGFVRPEDSDPDRGSVVYNDNHVVYETDMAAIRELLKKQNNGLTMEDMTRMQENAGD